LAEERTRAFPNLEAVQPFLMLDLQRLYIVKNLAAIRSDEVRVELALAGQRKKVYKKGESLSFRFKAPVDGYLNLINVTSQGKPVLLFPSGDESNAVKAAEPIVVPRDPELCYQVSGPFGPEYVKALFTTVPLDLKFLSQSENEDVDALLKEIEAGTRSVVRPRNLGAADPEAGVQGSRLGTAEVRYNTAPEK
jgi:hypothetical protein